MKKIWSFCIVFLVVFLPGFVNPGEAAPAITEPLESIERQISAQVEEEQIGLLLEELRRSSEGTEEMFLWQASISEEQEELLLGLTRK